MHRKILLATAALGLLIFGPGVPTGAETPPAKPENLITGVAPNPLFLTCGSPATFVPYYYMGKVVVRISDATGKVIREIDGRGFKTPGVLDWDLKDAAGKIVSPGEYAAVAIDEKGEEVSRCKLAVLK